MSESTPFPYGYVIPDGAPNAGKTPRALIAEALTDVGTAYNALNEAVNSPDGDLTFEQVTEELNNAVEKLEGITEKIGQVSHTAATIVTYGQGAQA